MSLLNKILATAFAVGIGLATTVSVSHAGSLVENEYSSNLGYTFVPPEGWIKYDASTAEILPGIPENLKDVNFSRFDVVFFQPSEDYKSDTLEEDTKRVEARKKDIIAGTRPAPGTPDGNALDTSEAEERTQALPKSPEFSASIAVMVVQHAPSKVDSEFANKYAEQFKQEVSNTWDIDIRTSTSDEIQGQKAMLFLMETRNSKRDMRIEQTIITNDDKSIIVTCISDTNEHMTDKSWCRKATRSIRFH